MATGKTHEKVLFKALLSLHILGDDGGINSQVSTEWMDARHQDAMNISVNKFTFVTGGKLQYGS